MDTSPVAIITGASSGIGEATARLLAHNGYRVVIAARRMDKLEALAAQASKEGLKMLPIFLDMSNLSSIQNVIKNTIDQYSRIDVLVNNAGFGRVGWLENLDIQGDVEYQIQVNLVGLIETTQLVLPTMIQQRYGHIINICSISGLIGSPTYCVYAASKFGVRGFSEALRREVSVWGIHVSTIYPGTVKTEFGLHTGAVRKTGVTTPSALQLSPEYLANTILKVIKRPRRTVIVPKIYLLAIWQNAILPSLGDYFMKKFFVYRERVEL